MFYGISKVNLYKKYNLYLMKINYVIATYNGSLNRTHTHPKPEDILKYHIDKINSLKHNLTTITIMKARCEKEAYPTYYKILRNNIKIIDVENYGYSMGQWLRAFELDRTYDYYFFLEDDYCMNMDNFDSLLINIYNNKFKKKIGMLCSLAQGEDDNKGYPKHFEGGILLSRESLECLYGKFINPRRELDRIHLKDEKYGKILKEKRNIYIGAFYQLTFSYLFTLAGIEIDDYLDVKYKNNKLSFGFWSDSKKKVYFYEKGDKLRENYNYNDIKNCPVIPVQYINKKFISFHGDFNKDFFL